MNLLRLFYRPTTVNDTTNDDYICTLHDPYTVPLEATRTRFGSGRTAVYAWPSSGGVWVHESCYGVELDFLGLPRFDPSPTERESNPDREDAFCKRLQWIGGCYFESDMAYRQHMLEAFDWPTPHRSWIGWPGEVPGGGVWVLGPKYGREEAELGAGRIRNAYTMEERCKVIEMLGGRFYQNWEDVEKLLSAYPDEDYRRLCQRTDEINDFPLY